MFCVRKHLIREWCVRDVVILVDDNGKVRSDKIS